VKISQRNLKKIQVLARRKARGVQLNRAEKRFLSAALEKLTKAEKDALLSV
jgi:urease gamma subunit